MELLFKEIFIYRQKKKFSLYHNKQTLFQNNKFQQALQVKMLQMLNLRIDSLLWGISIKIKMSLK